MDGRMRPRVLAGKDFILVPHDKVKCGLVETFGTVVQVHQVQA